MGMPDFKATAHTPKEWREIAERHAANGDAATAYACRMVAAVLALPPAGQLDEGEAAWTYNNIHKSIQAGKELA